MNYMIKALDTSVTATATAQAEAAMETIAEVTGNENLNPGVIQKYMKELPDKAFALAVKVVIAIIVLIVLWQVIKLVCNIIEKSLEKTKIDKAMALFLSKFVRVALEIMLLFSIAAGFGMDTASIVALLGSAGVAVGLAVQGTLSDFASGILILIAKPFRVGDYIEVGGTGMEGTVTEIALINTRMLTADFRKVVMPNKILASATVVNNFGNTMRILDTMCDISYSADIDKARSVALDVMRDNEFISNKQECAVYVDKLGDSGVTLRIRGWVKPQEYLKAKWSMNEAVKKAFDRSGVEIPFPQMDVHMK